MIPSSISCKTLVTASTPGHHILKTVLLFLLFTFFGFASNASDYYWVNGTGNWSDFAHHWATTSGGVIFQVSEPDSTDNVFFDANSFPTTGDTVRLDSYPYKYANTMDWTSAANFPVLQGSPNGQNALYLYGSLILSPTMKWNLQGDIVLSSTATGNIINTNGVALSDSLNYTLIEIIGTGSWDIESNLTGAEISVWHGALNSNNFTINGYLEVGYGGVGANPPSVILGTSNIIGQAYFGDGAIVDADSAIFNVVELTSKSGHTFYDVICTGAIAATNSTFNTIQCTGFYGDSNSVNEVHFLDNNVDFLNVYNYNSNSIIGSANYFHKATIPCSYLTIEGNQVFDSLFLNNPGQIVKLVGDTITINNFLSVGGTCSNRTSILDPTDTSEIVFGNGNYSFDYLFLQNVNTSGAATISLTNSIAAGAANGWNINAPVERTLFWVGGTGNWSDPAHWSTASGGLGGACTPTRYDSLFFDVNSFPSTGDTVYVDATLVYCKYMDWSGASNLPVLKTDTKESRLDVYSSIILNPLMTVDFNGVIRLLSDSTANIISTFGIDIPCRLSIEGKGSWGLQSDLKDTAIEFIHGTLYTNNFDLNGETTTYSNSSNVTVYLGTSTVKGIGFIFYSGANIKVYGSNAIFNVGTFASPDSTTYSDISCYSMMANACTFHNVVCTSFAGNQNTFTTLLLDSSSFSVGNLFYPNYGQLSGANNFVHKASIRSLELYYGLNTSTSFTFDSLLYATPGQQLYFGTGSTIRVNAYLDLNGSCSAVTSLICSGGYATFYKIGSAVISEYLFLQNMNRTGAAFIANNSINGGGNNGWTINAPAARTLYWVGGAGNFLDYNHWSTSSGGSGGACVPNQLDDVNFDANSFSSPNDTVFSSFKDIYIHSINWSAVTDTPTFFLYDYDLYVFGSLILSPAMKLIAGCNFRFLSNSSGNVISTGGNMLGSPAYSWREVTFDGSGSWDLAGDLIVSDVDFNNGTFRTNNYTLEAYGINRYPHEVTPTIFFGTSIIKARELDCNGANTIFYIDSCTIFAQSLNSNIYGLAFNNVYGNPRTESCTFNYLECSGVQGNGNSYLSINFVGNYYNSIGGSNNVFHKVVLPGAECFITGVNTFDTLVFNSPGQNISLNGSSSMIVNNYLGIFSSISNQTAVTCNNGTATFTKLTDTVCTDYVKMQNINATGGAVFYAGASSVDQGNNSGWIWSSCDPDTNFVWPGDANDDLIADNTDLLYIGLAYGYTGPTRANASNNWIGQPSVDWQQQFANGVNLKNADCNGDGVVNADDTLAVSLNYGQSHPFRVAHPLVSAFGGADLYFDLPSGALSPGTVVSIPILFGTANYPVTSLYGMAFTINYDPAYVQPGTMHLDFSNSWLGTNANTLHLLYDNYANGKIDCGFVRIDHQNISGSGQFAMLTFTVATAVSGNLNLNFSNIFALDKNEVALPVQSTPASIYTSVNELFSPESMISIYPNPATDVITISDPNAIIRQYEVFDQVGQSVLTAINRTGKTEINLTTFSSGMYLLKMETKRGIVNKKIIIK